MRGIGKYSVLAATGLVLAGGVLILAPTEASAQFPNIDSIIRGAMQHPYGGNGYYRGPSTHHSKSHEDSDNTPAKEKDATQDESQSANGGTRPSGSPQNTMRSQTSDAAPQSSSGPSRTTNDQPSFAPSR
jgi:hypothetical protein